MFVLDSHCDTPTMMMRGRDIGIDNERGHVDLPKLKAGGVDASFFALYTSADMTPDASTRHALEMIGRIYDQIGANPDLAALAMTQLLWQVDEANASGHAAARQNQNNSFP